MSRNVWRAAPCTSQWRLVNDSNERVGRESIFPFQTIAGVGTYDSLCTNFNYYQLFRGFHFLVAVALAAMSSLGLCHNKICQFTSNHLA